MRPFRNVALAERPVLFPLGGCKPVSRLPEWSFRGLGLIALRTTCSRRCRVARSHLRRIYRALCPLRLDSALLAVYLDPYLLVGCLHRCSNGFFPTGGLVASAKTSPSLPARSCISEAVPVMGCCGFRPLWSSGDSSRRCLVFFQDLSGPLGMDCALGLGC